MRSKTVGRSMPRIGAGWWCAIFGLVSWLSGFAGAVGSSNSISTLGMDRNLFNHASNIPTIPNYKRRAEDIPPECNAHGTIEINSQADADIYSNCSTLHSNVLIQNDRLESLTLSGIGAIEGHLEVRNCSKLQNISAPALGKIGSRYESRLRAGFTLSNLPLLHTVHFPAFNNSVGNLDFNSLPLLKDVRAKIYPIYNTTLENTGLTSTEFLYFFDHENGNNGSYGKIRIANNPDLSVISLDALSRVLTDDLNVPLEITNNGPGTQVLLRKLDFCFGLTISNVLSIEIPLLTGIHGTLLVSNNDLKNFSAPSLTTIQGDLIFKNNNELPYLAFPLLQTMPWYNSDDASSRNIVIENNAALSVIEFSTLSPDHDGNDITISGPLSRLNIPTLEASADYGYMYGNFKVNSTGSGLDCRPFDKLHYNTHEGVSARHRNLTYLCQSIAPGSKHDTAKHWKRPFRLSKAGKNALISVASLVGAFIFILLYRWCLRRFPEVKYRPQTIIINRPGVAVHRERSSTEVETDGHELPEYKRVGGPGEIPPEYHHVVPVASNVDSPSGTSRSTENNTDVEAGTVTPPVYHETHDREADDYMAANNDPSEHPVHRETPVTSESIVTAPAAPAAPAMRERSLLGKLWYGRALVPVKPR